MSISNPFSAVSLLVAFALPVAVFAEDAEKEALKQEVATLKQKLDMKSTELEEYKKVMRGALEDIARLKKTLARQNELFEEQKKQNDALAEKLKTPAPQPPQQPKLPGRLPEKKTEKRSDNPPPIGEKDLEF